MSDLARTLLRGLGQTLITLGLVLLLFCVYELEVTGIYTARQQDGLGRALARQWAAPLPAGTRRAPVVVELGEGLARLYVPRLGRDYREVVVEGVAKADLRKGPGHYPGTALPGDVGNVVLSGHRTTYGAPFNRVDELRTGDPVVLETRAGWFTYRVTGEQVVAPDAVDVLLPVPGSPGVRPTAHLLTLTTCNPKYSARQRLVVRAVLDSALPHASGLPPALAG